MTASYTEARDEMMALVAAAKAIVAPTARIEWEGGPESATSPGQTEEWLHVSMQHDVTGSRQASLSCANGKRRWRREGMLFVQCFAPLSAGGLKRAMVLAVAFRDAFQASQGTPGGVWFRNPTAREIGPDRNWFNANASARFTYDEVN